MRKALKAATLMGLAAALIVPASPAKAGDMDMGDTKITISGQLRERLEWYANTIKGAGKELVGSYRARLQIKAQLADGVTAVFTPQAVGVWGQNGQGLALGEKATVNETVSGATNTVNMHEAYMLLSNPFGIENVIVKLGRQEVNLGNQRLVGAVGWSQAGRSLDGILVGYVAGDYGLAGFFYGKLNDNATLGAWASPGTPEYDIDLYVATWQGNFKPFGFGGTYEITDVYVNPTTNFSKSLGLNPIDINVNTLYGRVTPVFDTDFAKIKLNLEAAVQTGNADIEGGKSLDFNGYFFSVGAGATFADVTWAPTVFVGYDYYSGDDDTNDSDIDAFWSVLPTAHKWLGHADLVWVNTPFYQFNGAGLVNVIKQGAGLYKVNNQTANVAGVQDLYFKLGVKPLDKVAAHLDFHYFSAAEDLTIGGKNVGDDIGWETDLAVKYKYSKNLCLTLGWDHFDPDDAMEAVKGNDDAEDHFWFQADLKF
jgi:hypothetical protein